ncbi:MAG: carbohydrate porin [Candidatus Methylomirabilia bacterium]
MAVFVVGLATIQVLDPEFVSAQSGPQTEEQNDELRAKVDRLVEQLGRLHLALGVTGILQGTVNNEDNNPAERNTTDANWSLDLEVGAPIAEQGDAFVLIEAGQGEGVTDEPGVAESFFGVNDDAADSGTRLEVTEAWYEHELWGERAVVTIGKVDLTNYFDASAVETAWSAGIESGGTWWRRAQDVAAVALGQANLSSEFERGAGAPARSDDELFVEAYYRFVFNENLALSAHLQVIDNPGGDEALDTVTVLGGRVQVNF